MSKIKFKNKKDLEKFLKKKINKETKINNMTTKGMLEEEAKKLKQLIQKYIKQYYRNYQPVVYRRTYDLLNSLKIEPVKIQGEIISIKLYFDESAYKPSVVFNSKTGSFDEEGFTPILIDVGWHWNKSYKKRIPYFTDFEGIHFVEKAIKEYSKDGISGIKIKVIKEYTGKRGHWIDINTWYI